uniref:Uncharacterized protein n=3 Tax=Monodon monoceros TaxID=40151 RepID=A0A8C6ARV8_MONMO
MPSFMLKKIVLGNFSSGPVDPMMADAIDFMVDRLESLGQSELASRLTLNCQNSYVEPHKIRDIPVTIMDVSFLLSKIDALPFLCICQDPPYNYFMIFQCASSNNCLGFSLFLPPSFFKSKIIFYCLSCIFPGRNNSIEIKVNLVLTHFGLLCYSHQQILLFSRNYKSGQ